DVTFALVVRLPADGPWEMLRVVPFGGAGRDEQLRHLLGVHVFLDRRVGRRAERLEGEQHLVALDELSDLLDRLGRAVAVVVGDEIDLAAVDAALGIDLVEIAGDRLTDDAVGRGRAAVRIGVADLDLGVARPRIVFLLRGGGGCREGHAGEQRDEQPGFLHLHSFLPWNRLFAQPGRYLPGEEPREARGPARHDVDDQDQDNAVYRPGQALGDLLGDVGHEQNKQAPDQRTGDRANATDHEAHEQRDRQEERKTVRCDELYRNRPERAGDPGVERADPEGERLVEGDVDAHRARRDRILADGDDGPASAAAHQTDGARVEHDRNRDGEEIQPLIGIDRQAERRVRLDDHHALDTAGPR